MEKISKDELVEKLTYAVQQIETAAESAYELLHDFGIESRIKNSDEWYEEYLQGSMVGFHEDKDTEFPGLYDILDMIENRII